MEEEPLALARLKAPLAGPGSALDSARAVRGDRVVTRCEAGRERLTVVAALWTKRGRPLLQPIWR